jgi:hypothetical protein
MIRNLTIVAALALGAVGCQRAAPTLPPLHPASGTVVYKGGGPVVGRIKFLPTSSSEFRGEAIVGKDGKFTLQTVRADSDEATAGIPAGDYKVSVIPIMPNAVPTGGRPDIQLPDPVHVKEGENAFHFEIPRKP